MLERFWCVQEPIGHCGTLCTVCTKVKRSSGICYPDLMTLSDRKIYLASAVCRSLHHANLTGSHSKCYSSFSVSFARQLLHIGQFPSPFFSSFRALFGCAQRLTQQLNTIRWIANFFIQLVFPCRTSFGRQRSHRHTQFPAVLKENRQNRAFSLLKQVTQTDNLVNWKTLLFV